MTASPTPPDFFAESANKSATPPDAQVGLLSEEEIARAICASDFDYDETVYDTLSSAQRLNFAINARAILDLIRPAFEAKERGGVGNSDGIASPFNACCYRDECRAMEARARSAEAKLAQAVEALGRAKDEIVRTADDLSMHSPTVKLVEEIAAIIGQPALNSRAIVREAARAAARGEKT